MIHEPECGYHESADGITVYESCLCPVLRSAYQRGREDTAQRVREVADSESKYEPFFSFWNALCKAIGEPCAHAEINYRSIGGSDCPDCGEKIGEQG